MEDGRPVSQSIDVNSQLKGRHDFGESRMHIVGQSIVVNSQLRGRHNFEEPRLMLPRGASAYSSPFHSRESSIFLLIWIYVEEMNGLYHGKDLQVGNTLVQTTIALVSGRFVEG